MIEQEQVMPLLLEACPSFEERWAAYLSEEYAAGDERLIYCELGEFARHLIDLASSGNVQEIPAIFEVIERLHLEGTPYVRGAATIGLLEGIQNNASHSGFDLAKLTPYLLPESAYWWQQLNDFWQGKIRFVGEGPRRKAGEEN
jgi:hypothetical protein